MDGFIYTLLALMALTALGMIAFTVGAFTDDRAEQRAAERNIARMLAEQTGPVDGK